MVEAPNNKGPQENFQSNQVSLAELCNYLENKIASHDLKGTDYLKFLADKATAYDKPIPESGIEPTFFFSSPKFSGLQEQVSQFRQMKLAM